ERRLQRLLEEPQLSRAARALSRGDADGARVQRLERAARALGAALRGAREARRAGAVLLPPGRPRRTAAARADEPLVHALSLRRAERRREGPARLDRARARSAGQADALRGLSEPGRGARDALPHARRRGARRPESRAGAESRQRNAPRRL